MKFSDKCIDDTTRGLALARGWKALDTINALRRQHHAPTLSGAEFSALVGTLSPNLCEISDGLVIYRITDNVVTAEPIAPGLWPELTITGIHLKPRGA